MTNITLLAATRPRLLKQALESMGDLSQATVMIRDAQINPQVTATAAQWANPKSECLMTYGDKPLGTGPARNQVIADSSARWGRGDFLYLSDDDVYWTDPNWLTILTQTYTLAQPEGFAVLAAYNHPFNRPIAPPLRLMNRWNVNEVYAVATQSMLMTWDVWDRFGPFCDTPAGKVCQSEDVDFCNRIRAAGMKVGVIAPPLLVNCGITNSFGEKIPGWELVKSQCPEGVICE